MLDGFSLQVSFALIALTSAGLFFVNYRATGSRYSLFWTAALVFLMAGASAYLLEGTPLQAIGLPVGDGLTLVGVSFCWAAARALRLRRLSVWAFVVPATVTGVSTALSDPGNDVLAGALVRYVALATVFALTAREVTLVDSRFTRARWTLFTTSIVLAGYYAIRAAVRLVGPSAGDVLLAFASETAATLVTQLALVTVSFGMVAVSLAEREARLKSTARSAARELGEGTQVQRTLLPIQRPTGVQFPVAGSCVPSRSLSGDFFDWRAGETSLVVTVGDVMGKGVGAAMLGATIRAGLRVARGGDPADDLRVVADELGPDLVRNGSFVTLFHAHLDRATNVLSVLDAGHGLAVLVRSDGTRERIVSGDLPLGLDVANGWTVKTYALDPGDRLFVFSDGVLDLFDGTLDALDKALDVATGDGMLRVEDSVDRIRELADSGAHDDDVTVLVVERPAVRAEEPAIG